MAYTFQVTIDSVAPHPLADWWVDALGWEREPSNEEFIQSMVDQGQATEADTLRHHGTLVWKAGAAINHPGGGAPRVLFQLVPEAKSVKNRVHLDVRVGAEQLASEVERLTARGATLLHHGEQGPFRLVTLADPEGNEFCLT
jgi:hypothetical protein